MTDVSSRKVEGSPDSNLRFGEEEKGERIKVER